LGARERAGKLETRSFGDAAQRLRPPV
jgi:hypothetical protein